MARIEIPKPYIFTIDSPLILFQGRLLQPSNETDSANNYMEFSPHRYSLQEIVTPKELEDLYFLHNESRFEGFQAAYIQSTIRKELRASASQRQAVIDNKIMSFIVNDVLPLITAEKLENDIGEILDKDIQERYSGRRSLSNRQPEISGSRSGHRSSRTYRGSSGISREVIDEARNLKTQFMRKLDAEYDRYDRKIRRTRPRNIDDRITEILRNQEADMTTYDMLFDDSMLNISLLAENIMFIGDKIYDIVSVKEFVSYFREYIRPGLYRTLTSFEPSKDPEEINAVIRQNILDIDKKCRSRIRNKLKSSRLRINGNYYIPFLKEDSAQFRDALIADYSKLIEKRIKIGAFEKYEQQTEEIYELAEEQRKLQDIAQRRSYEKHGAGFEIIGGEYYVYVTTPSYALRSPHMSSEPRYVAFEPARIGVKVMHNYGIFEFSNPRIMHKYRHPFLSDAPAYKDICLGGTGSAKANDFRRLKPEQTVIALLDQGKKTLMMGYRSGENPYLRLEKEYLWKFITKAEVERRRLACLNEEHR
jgi:hypothetical protein